VSSILDALNKVERDQIEEDEIVNGEVDAATAARYLYGSAARKRRGRAKRRLFRWETAMGAASVIVLTVAVAAALVMLGVIPPVGTSMTGGPAPSEGIQPGMVEPASVAALTGPGSQSTASAIEADGAGTVAPGPDVPATGELSTETPQPVGPQPSQPPVGMDPLSQSPRYEAPRALAPGAAEAAPYAPQHQAPSMAPYAEMPQEQLPPVRQEVPPHQDAPGAPSGAEALPKDLNIRSLPRLTPSEQARLGLPRLEVGLVGMPRAHRKPSAMINYNKVLVNEYIPNTNVRLVAVDIYGVAVEHKGRYYFLAIRG
jgi:hypothetical protein